MRRATVGLLSSFEVCLAVTCFPVLVGHFLLLLVCIGSDWAVQSVKHAVFPAGLFGFCAHFQGLF